MYVLSDHLLIGMNLCHLATPYPVFIIHDGTTQVFVPEGGLCAKQRQSVRRSGVWGEPRRLHSQMVGGIWRHYRQEMVNLLESWDITTAVLINAVFYFSVHRHFKVALSKFSCYTA